MTKNTDPQQQLTGIGASPGQASGPVATMPDPVAEPLAGSTLAAGVDVEQAAQSIAAASGVAQAALQEAASRTNGAGKEVLETPP